MSSYGTYTDFNQGIYQQRYNKAKITIPILNAVIFLVAISKNNPCKKDLYFIMVGNKIDWENI